MWNHFPTGSEKLVLLDEIQNTIIFKKALLPQGKKKKKIYKQNSLYQLSSREMDWQY